MDLASLQEEGEQPCPEHSRKGDRGSKVVAPGADRAGCYEEEQGSTPVPEPHGLQSTELQVLARTRLERRKRLNTSLGFNNKVEEGNGSPESVRLS